MPDLPPYVKAEDDVRVRACVRGSQTDTVVLGWEVSGSTGRGVRAWAGTSGGWQRPTWPASVSVRGRVRAAPRHHPSADAASPVRPGPMGRWSDRLLVMSDQSHRPPEPVQHRPVANPKRLRLSAPARTTGGHVVAAPQQAPAGPSQ